MSKKIKNILFDFGGVIVSLNKQQAINRFKEIGVDDIENYLGEFRQSGIFLDYEEGKITSEGFYAALRKLAGKEDITAEEIDSAWLAFLIGIPPYKFQLLKDLRKEYKLYLLSNTNPSIMRWAQSSNFSPEGLPITAFFDKCYLSYEIGSAKPDKGIFEYVINDLKALGVEASETLFLDDGQANIDKGNEFGLKGYLANQDEDLCKVFENLA